MTKSLRFISLIIATVFLISGVAMVVCHADPDTGGGGSGEVSGGGSGEVSGGGGGEVSGGGGGEVSGGSGGEVSGGSGGEVSGGGGYDSGGSGGYDSGGSGSYDSGGSGSYDSGYSSDSYSGYSSDNYSSGGSGQVEDSDPIYYGDASHYSYNNSVDSTEAAEGSVSSSLYNSSGMSDAEAAPNEWSDITLDEKTVKTGITDFSSIKENTEVEDNGYWILYLGYALLALAGLGILYFIVATIAHRSAVRKAERKEQRRRASSSPSHSAAARMEERERRESGSGRTSRFADEDAPVRSRRASSRSDTGEVYVPRRAAKR